jgi:hypothetical protein
MVDGYYRRVTDLLKKEAGAVYVRGGKGSHEHWMTKDGIPLVVPRNLDKRHTANAILQRAGLGKPL